MINLSIPDLDRPTFGSLFSGIGGMDLGLERAGFECKWQVEINDYASQVLRHHWPTVARYRDIRHFLASKRWRRVRAAWNVDVVCGGFPCQDISNAGRREGIGGKRSGLWREFARVIRLLRPPYVIVENVPALTVRGLGTVLGDLASLGYDAEWDMLPAWAVGAPHRRWRLFLVAHANGSLCQGTDDALRSGRRGLGGSRESAATKPSGNGRNARRADNSQEVQGGRESDRSVVSQAIPDAMCIGREGGEVARLQEESIPGSGCKDAPANADNQGQLQPQGSERDQRRRLGDRGKDSLPHSQSIFSGQCWREQFAAYCQSQQDLYWSDPEPWLRRVDDGLAPTMDGVANRAERLVGLGNAVLPQLAEWIGKQLMRIIQC